MHVTNETAGGFYVDLLMLEWRRREWSHRVQSCVRRVLRELTAEALLTLRDPKLAKSTGGAKDPASRAEDRRKV